MKNLLIFLSLYVSTGFIAMAQTAQNAIDLKDFDAKKAWNHAVSKTTSLKEQKEIFESEKRKHIANKKPVVSNNQVFQYTYDAITKTVIAKLSPTNSYCQNAGFENGNFQNWTGSTGFNPPSTWTSGIATLGPNTPAQAYANLSSTQYRHTILTIPPTTNNPPFNCVGWDSLAIDPVTHLSAIPFTPLSSNGVTVRLGNANTGAEAERLKYTIAVTAQNTQFTYAYAVVLNDGGHTAIEQPYFRIIIRDQNNNLLPGCGQYDINALLATTDPSFKLAAYWDGTSYQNGIDIYYKPWTLVGVDLTAYIGTNVTVEFETADCTLGGHWGYAYVDATCGPATALVNMCSGSTLQTLVAPQGYSTYQWFGPNANTQIPSPQGINDTLLVNNGVVGDTYTVQCVSAAGCTVNLVATLQYDSVDVVATSSLPSCAGGTSGVVSVIPTGSPDGTYTYIWKNSLGATIGSSQTVSGLSPGTYSVNVSSPGCGQKDTVVTVGITPVTVTQKNITYCDSVSAQLTIPIGSTNIQWYNTSSVVIAAPQGTNDTLFISNLVDASKYYVVYNPAGSSCKDSVVFTLVKNINDAYLAHSNLINTCGNSSTGQVDINYFGIASTFNQSVIGSNGYTYNNPSQTNMTQTLSNLGRGTYTMTVVDGQCTYTHIFKIDTISVPVNVQVTPTTLGCKDSAKVVFNYPPGYLPTQCGVSNSTNNHVVSTHQVGTGSNSLMGSKLYSAVPVKSQMLILASELTAAGMGAGKINSLAFKVVPFFFFTSDVIIDDFTISLGCTSLSSLPLSAHQTGLTQVFSRDIAQTPDANDWVTHQFDQGFDWDGTSNIIVEVCRGFTPILLIYPDVESTTKTFNALVELADVSAFGTYTCDGPVVTPSWTDSGERPNMKFGFIPTKLVPTNFTYSWNPTTGIVGQSSPSVSSQTVILAPTNTTTYTLSISNTGNTCPKKEIFTVTRIPLNPITIALPASLDVCSETEFSISPAFTGGNGSLAYNWYYLPNTSGSISSASVLTTIAPSTEGTYTIQVNASDSCGVSDTEISVITVANCDIEIPNVITPNGDNVNEAFVIKNLGYHPNSKLIIFDRWGKKAFESDNYKNDWKADSSSDGTFFYVLTLSDTKKEYSGFITVYHQK